LSFFDDNGLLHVEPDTPSENGILFLAELTLLKIANGFEPDIERISKAILSTITADPREHWFSSNPDMEGSSLSGFSHDNMTGLYCLLYIMEGVDMSKLPIMKWNNRYWLHPRDIIYYLLLRIKFNPLRAILTCLLLPFMVHSCLRPREETSGKCLWLLRLVTINLEFNNKWTYYPSTALLFIANTLLSIKHGDEHWIDILYIYFKNTNHPIREQVREIYY
jgi:hypothetical protein